VVEADLRRRDLTINALAFRPGTGEVVDPTGGLADLRRGLVRAVARENLWADPLRAWRVVRFAAQLGFRVERRTRGWVQELARALAAADRGPPARRRARRARRSGSAPSSTTRSPRRSPVAPSRRSTTSACWRRCSRS
jgi:tRNA nucleotidyltransferase/poly(A) polymerase